MIYIAHLEYYNDFDNKNRTVSCFVAADSFKEVVETLGDYYGEKNFDTIEIIPFSPDNFLEFQTDGDVKEINLFAAVKYRLGERVIW